MSLPMMLAQGTWSFPAGGLWGFGALVLLILFVTLVVSDGSKDKDP